MGSIKKIRKKYEVPFKHWDLQRMLEEVELTTKFGLKNKREVWKARSRLKQVRTAARNLFTKTGTVAEREKKELIEKLYRIGMLEQNATLDDVLGLTVENILERRLQTIALRKGMAITPKQARQFITHGHIAINGSKVFTPGYIVPRADTDKIAFTQASALGDTAHPTRAAKPRPVVPREDRPMQRRPFRGGGGFGGDRRGPPRRGAPPQTATKQTATTKTTGGKQ